MVLDAALQIVRRQGMAALTVQAVAGRLDASRAPVYALFPSREALSKAVIEHVLAEQLPDPVPDGIGWAERLRFYAFSAFDTYQAYPGVANELMKTGFPDTEMGRRAARFMVDTLKEAGFHTTLIPSLILAITGLVSGVVMEIQGQTERERLLSRASPQDRHAYQRRRGNTLPVKPLDKEDFARALDVLIRGLRETPRGR